MKTQQEVEKQIEALKAKSVELQKSYVTESKGYNSMGVLKNINAQISSLHKDIKTLQWVLGLIEWEL